MKIANMEFHPTLNKKNIFGKNVAYCKLGSGLIQKKIKKKFSKTPDRLKKIMILAVW